MTAPDEMLDHLLVDHATEGLSDDQWREVLQLQDEQGVGHDIGYDRAAAAIDLAHTVEEPMPSSLQQRLQDQARGYFAAQASPARRRNRHGADLLTFPVPDAGTVAPSASVDRGSDTVPADDTVPAADDLALPSAPSEVSRRTPWTAWAAAVAASLVAVLGWAPRLVEQWTGDPAALNGGPVGNLSQRSDDFERRRDQLIGGQQAVVQVAWSGTEDPAAQGAGGDLVWSTDLQEGYMLFNGLPVNNPAEWQYQLWIFDKLQDERYPIDGGVFDVNADGSVVVPIRAKLRVNEPYLFAITIEKPGGVVVSSRERLPLIASL